MEKGIAYSWVILNCLQYVTDYDESSQTVASDFSVDREYVTILIHTAKVCFSCKASYYLETWLWRWNSSILRRIDLFYPRRCMIRFYSNGTIFRMLDEQFRGLKCRSRCLLKLEKSVFALHRPSRRDKDCQFVSHHHKWKYKSCQLLLCTCSMRLLNSDKGSAVMGALWWNKMLLRCFSIFLWFVWHHSKRLGSRLIIFSSRDSYDCLGAWRLWCCWCFTSEQIQNCHYLHRSQRGCRYFW